MAKGTLGQVVKRAISDAAFRRQLQADPNGALKGFDLTGDERAALRSGDASKLTSLGVDQRMSKTFALGEGASAVSKWGTGNDLAMGATVPDGGGEPLVNDALISGGGGRASDALIGDASGVKFARITDAGGPRSAIRDSHDSARAAIDDNAGGPRSALDNSGTASREGTAYITADEAGRDASPATLASSDSPATSAFITADEAGNNVVAGGSAGAQNALGAADPNRGDAYISANEWSSAQGAQSSLDVSGQERGSAFMTADEMGNDVAAPGSASYPDSADTQREALANDTTMANPEGYDKPDVDA